MPFDICADTSPLAVYRAACTNPDSADWRRIADMLAFAIETPKPRRARKAAPPPDLGEWCEYTPGQRKGRGAMFASGRIAVFRFADGEVIKVSLSHRSGQEMPDWAKAAECAVAFYKTRRARNFSALVSSDGKACLRFFMTDEERYARSCSVPEIVEARDMTRDTLADVSRANAHTAALRTGPRYLADLVDLACQTGGDWRAAWRLHMMPADAPEWMQDVWL